MGLWKIARPPAWAAFRMLCRLNLMFSRREYRYVFILGHMRSGSTLLAHILASHQDFVGAGETHISYRTPADLPTLVLKTCELLHRPALQETHIVDQINHPYVTDDVLRSKRVYKCVILLREPEATLKSMMNLAIWQEKQALEIYINRLEALTHYGLLLGERALLVEYDALVDHTEQALAALTSFFGLESPLMPNYATNRMTRRVSGYGDPSNNITIGRIVRTPNHELTISRETVTAATRAFFKCRGELQAATIQTMHRVASPDQAASKPALNG
jgi:hypothetical protein